jgi:hypothetical protein
MKETRKKVSFVIDQEGAETKREDDTTYILEASLE